MYTLLPTLNWSLISELDTFSVWSIPFYTCTLSKALICKATPYRNTEIWIKFKLLQIHPVPPNSILYKYTLKGAQLICKAKPYRNTEISIEFFLQNLQELELNLIHASAVRWIFPLFKVFIHYKQCITMAQPMKRLILTYFLNVWFCKTAVCT